MGYCASFARRAGVIATSILVAASVCMIPASAEPDPVEEVECTTSEYEAADCLWFAASPNEDPLTQGLGQAIERGDREIADKYIAQYVEVNDLTQSEERALEEDAEAASTPSSLPSSASSIDGGMQVRSGGTTSGFTNIIKDTVSYGKCGLSSCKVTGRTSVDFRYELEGVADFSLVGDIDVVSGGAISVTDARCRTRYNNGALPDITVKTWSNCPYWGESSQYKTHYFILLDNWSGGSRGKIYHPDYKITFNVRGGPSISKTWRGHDYKIRESGPGRPYWV